MPKSTSKRSVASVLTPRTNPCSPARAQAKKQMESEVKVLLLGSGDSGKTTILKVRLD